ncbi:MAG TPA: response regulator [Gemmataceae bacterium]|jgi:CheY-like chemotaxis protein|nr:response regulator [Gemmataceae bacterium]
MPKVLIVEDNEDNRDFLSRHLERSGFEVVLARDGKVGVAMTQSEKPDFVLMDMNMPELDGWEATRQIKALADFHNLPVIALTAHAMAGDRERALAAGCADYHIKPVDFPKLLAQIEAILHNTTPPPDALAGHEPHEAG